jgi:hypothetical protein
MRHSELMRVTSRTARLDANGQLEPIAIDETLTTTLFEARGSNAPLTSRPGIEAAEAAEPLANDHAQAVLFELA